MNPHKHMRKILELPYCEKSRKRRHPSQNSASKHARRFEKERGEGSMKEYQCSHCGDWHVGHDKEKPPHVSPNILPDGAMISATYKADTGIWTMVLILDGYTDKVTVSHPNAGINLLCQRWWKNQQWKKETGNASKDQ